MRCSKAQEPEVSCRRALSLDRDLAPARHWLGNTPLDPENPCFAGGTGRARLRNLPPEPVLTLFQLLTK
jgi:hypothetical protein